MNPKCCGQESIKNTANFKEFYYCKVCKKEVVYLGVQQKFTREEQQILRNWLKELMAPELEWKKYES